MIELQNLSFRVDDGRTGILNDVSCRIDDGRYLVITGPNGGGKTTLAKAIMGLITPTSGKILLDGVDITEKSVTERAKMGLSYGFQAPPRFKGLTVQDLLNVAAGKTLSRDECCRYLTKVGLCATDYVNRECDASLSGGEMKRIEIATIFAKNSPVMIFDEPEAGIDLWSFTRLTAAFRELHENTNTTVIIISHQERIISQADEVILLSGGKIAKRGTPQDILGMISSVDTAVCKYMQ